MKAGGFYPDVGGKEKEWAGISSSFGKWSGSVASSLANTGEFFPMEKCKM